MSRSGPDIPEPTPPPPPATPPTRASFIGQAGAERRLPFRPRIQANPVIGRATAGGTQPSLLGG